MLSRTAWCLRHRVLFMGSSGISEPCLNGLIVDWQTRQEVCKELMVVTPPGTLQGDTGAAELARRHGVPHEEVRDKKTLKGWAVPQTKEAGDRWDIGVVVSFRYFIPPRVIRQFRLGVVNMHPSLLPKYRGSSPIQAALMHNDAVGGVSIIKIQPGEIMDTGDILKAAETPLSPTMTFETYLKVVSGIGADLVFKCLQDFEAVWAAAAPQPHKTLLPADDPTFAGILRKEDHHIRLDAMSADAIYHRWRALHGAGGTWCSFRRPRDHAVLRCHLKSVLPLSTEDTAALPAAAPGAAFFPQKNCPCFYVKARDGWVAVAAVHIACEKPKTAREFMTGYRFKPMVVHPGVME
eukprot:TRINITY_DN30160_c0_g1_i1.p1 TRINITY_DN30160_c0_g1~~TRINITY_DN30160_c0_g1_i1.p1  ORF type:complete len:350 (+),score=107.33 TRINITY_DN30160_c0_g1_i1:105-1154(+)